MRFSVVINTLNRAASLRQTLESLRYQLHDDFEVVVVNGPSTDDTETMLREYAGQIKHERCAVANLSTSRNIGIRAAAGDVVAFIDDDAIAEYHWLTDLERGFISDEVAGVGGVVFDHTGMQFQFKFGTSDRYGDTELTETLPDASAMCAPGGWRFPSLLGTNSSFRRTALAHIGLFDETYEYYLDETDVAVRMVDAGFIVTGFDGAPVHHHFLPSHVRNERRTVVHWYPVIKNRTYFALRHALGHRSMLDIIESAVQSSRQRLSESAWAEEAGLVPAGSTLRAFGEVDHGLSDGIRLADQKGWDPLPPVELDPPPFVRYPTKYRVARSRLVLVTSGYPPRSMAGISRFMSELAPTLAADGHDVRVITRTHDHESVTWEDGVWVHRLRGEHRGVVSGSFSHVDEFATSVVREIERFSPWMPPDAVYGAAWDVETLGVVRATALPAIIMLATPAAVAADEGGWFHDPSLAPGVRVLLDLERELFRSADLVHGISESIVETISAHYDSDPVVGTPVVGTPAGTAVFDHRRVEVFPLGMIDRSNTVSSRPKQTLRSAHTTVLFVGRLEHRKGIDVFLDAVEALAPQHPDVRFIVAGNDPSPPGKTSIARAWQSSHLDRDWFSNVDFVGEIDDETLHRLYASADVVVLPSRYESFGLVVVEAMMHGAAIVSSNVGGIAEVARADVDAILVPPGDAIALSTAVDGLLRDPERRVELGRNARRRFLDSFNIRTVAGKISRLQDRVSMLASPRAVELVADQPLDVAGDPGHLGQLCFQTATGAIVTVSSDTATSSVRVGPPGGRAPLSFGASGHISVTVVRGSATLAGVVQIAPSGEVGH